MSTTAMENMSNSVPTTEFATDYVMCGGFPIMRKGRAKKDGVIYLGPYGRVSTDKDDQRNSLASQRSYFAEIIGREPGLALYSEYFDEGISGTSLKKRDAFNRMIADAVAGKIDVIVTKEVSRFARNTVDVLSVTRELKQRGVQVIFLNDRINTFSSDCELRLSFMASLAQEESRKTSERVKWGQARRMEQGVVFGRSLIGYDVSGGKLVVNPAGARIVKLVFHKFLNEGLGAFRIARDLEDAGISTYHGESRWSPKVIYSILKNEKYVGDLEQKKTYTPDYLSHNKMRNNGDEARVFIRDHHDGIIDRATWDAVQMELTRRGEMITQEQRSRYSNLYWCSGKLRCAECGAYLMRRVRRLTGGGERVSWCCSEATRFGNRKQDANGKAIGCDAGEVNEQVLKYCVRYCVQHVRFHQTRLISELSEAGGEEYIKRFKEILDCDEDAASDSDEFLGDVLEWVRVFVSDEIEVKLKAVPFSFRLRYVTSGRGESYTLRVNHRERVWEKED